MNKALAISILSLTALCGSIAPLHAELTTHEAFETRDVARICIDVVTDSTQTNKPERLLSRLRTKEGDPFSQLVFDQDLKTLTTDYDRVEPSIRINEDGNLNITIKLWQKPMIRSIKWKGNDNLSTRSLKSKLDIKKNSIFDRAKFNEAFNKVKEHYIKKGYFESRLEYKVIPDPECNSIDIEVTVCEGRSGHISQISFEGFDESEESELLSMINSKKYNFFTSWLTGRGTYYEEVLEGDRLIILNFLQNKGFADANVSIEATRGDDSKRLLINVEADRGRRYHFGSIDYKGNSLFDDDEIEKTITIKSEENYSPEALHKTIEKLKTLYGRKGYIDANIAYTLVPVPSDAEYNVDFRIDEGRQYRIGIIKLFGNVKTANRVLLHESLLVPGEIFDSAKLEATKHRLEAVGYFKSVNVYPVQVSNEDSDEDDDELYRDVVIEVEETTTGSVSFFGGFSSSDKLFGGIDLAENNFDHRGLTSFWRDGLSSLRGGGEYAHMRLSVGQGQRSVELAWMTPYYKDTLWRVGFDLSYSQNTLVSKDYHMQNGKFSLYGSYPLSPYWTTGWKFRVVYSDINIDSSAGSKAQEEENNSGWILGFGGSLNFDSTDSIYKPHRGGRSNAEIEIVGIKRRESHRQVFPYLRMHYLNTYYYPIWRKGIFKARADLRFMYLMGQGRAEKLPLSERFFLGGEGTVRGYRPFRIGPKFKDKDPKGGISSTLFSVEYLQEVIKLIDLFAFFDAGGVSLRQFNPHRINMSYGWGARLDVGNRVPFTFGMGYPINPTDKSEVKKFFFSMGAQF